MQVTTTNNRCRAVKDFKRSFEGVKAAIATRPGFVLDMSRAEFDAIPMPKNGRGVESPMFRAVLFRRDGVPGKGTISDILSGAGCGAKTDAEKDAANASRRSLAKARYPRGQSVSHNLETSRANSAFEAAGEGALYVRRLTWEFRRADAGLASREVLARHGIADVDAIPDDARVWRLVQDKTARLSALNRHLFAISIAKLIEYLELRMTVSLTGVILTDAGEVPVVRYLLSGYEDVGALYEIVAADDEAAAAYEAALTEYTSTATYKAAYATYTLALAQYKASLADAAAPRVDQPRAPALPKGPGRAGVHFNPSLDREPQGVYEKFMHTHRYDLRTDAGRASLAAAQAAIMQRADERGELVSATFMNEDRSMMGAKTWIEHQGYVNVRTALASVGIVAFRDTADNNSAVDYKVRLTCGRVLRIQAKTARKHTAGGGYSFGMRGKTSANYGKRPPYRVGDFCQFHIVFGNTARVLSMSAFTDAQLGAETGYLSNRMCAEYPAHDLSTEAGVAAFAAAVSTTV